LSYFRAKILKKAEIQKVFFVKNSEKRDKNRSFLRSVRNSWKKCGKRSDYDNKMIGKMGLKKMKSMKSDRGKTKRIRLPSFLKDSSLIYLFASTYKLGQLSDVLCKTRLQVCSLVLVNNVDLSQLV